MERPIHAHETAWARGVVMYRIPNSVMHRPTLIHLTMKHVPLRNFVSIKAILLTLALGVRAFGLEATVLCEEVVTAYGPANNGAGPLWCYGAPLLVRHGNQVSVSIIETGKGVPPLCNTRWQLWQRGPGSWDVVAEEDEYRQREPCLLVGIETGELFVSANPSTKPPGTEYGECQPVMFRFDQQNGRLTQAMEEPVWMEGTYFTDHSYRGIAADSSRRELVLLNIHARTSAQFVSHRDSHGHWHARGMIQFPIRAAYPQVAFRRGAVHVLAIGDIQEPNLEWRKLKFEQLGRKWDYVFRRLFYAFMPSIADASFRPPLEIDTVEETAGNITNLDLYVDAEGAAHLLYLKRPHVYSFLRDKYFPGEPFSQSLEYAVVHAGQVKHRHTLSRTPTTGKGFEPAFGRFHVGARGSLYVVAAGRQTATAGTTKFVNRIFPIESPRAGFEIPLSHPFHRFFTNTPRGGSQPSDELDLFGIAEDAPKLRYAHVRLDPWS